MFFMVIYQPLKLKSYTEFKKHKISIFFLVIVLVMLSLEHYLALPLTHRGHQAQPSGSWSAVMKIYLFTTLNLLSETTISQAQPAFTWI